MVVRRGPCGISAHAPQSPGTGSPRRGTPTDRIRMHASARDSHNRVQREYFDTVERPRLALGDTPYIRRHVEEVVSRRAVRARRVPARNRRRTRQVHIAVDGAGLRGDRERPLARPARDGSAPRPLAPSPRLPATSSTSPPTCRGGSMAWSDFSCCTTCWISRLRSVRSSRCSVLAAGLPSASRWRGTRSTTCRSR